MKHAAQNEKQRRWQWRATSNNVGQDMQDLRLSQCPRLYSCHQANAHTHSLSLLAVKRHFLFTHTHAESGHFYGNRQKGLGSISDGQKECHKSIIPWFVIQYFVSRLTCSDASHLFARRWKDNATACGRSNLRQEKFSPILSPYLLAKLSCVAKSFGRGLVSCGAPKHNLPIYLSY